MKNSNVGIEDSWAEEAIQVQAERNMDAQRMSIASMEPVK